jgi:hypothetical protein
VGTASRLARKVRTLKLTSTQATQQWNVSVALSLALEAAPGMRCRYMGTYLYVAVFSSGVAQQDGLRRHGSCFRRHQKTWRASLVSIPLCRVAAGTQRLAIVLVYDRRDIES